MNNDLAYTIQAFNTRECFTKKTKIAFSITAPITKQPAERIKYLTTKKLKDATLFGGKCKLLPPLF